MQKMQIRAMQSVFDSLEVVQDIRTTANGASHLANKGLKHDQRYYRGLMPVYNWVWAFVPTFDFWIRRINMENIKRNRAEKEELKQLQREFEKQQAQANFYECNPIR